MRCVHLFFTGKTSNLNHEIQGLHIFVSTYSASVYGS